MTKADSDAESDDDERRLEIIKSHVARLMEHFDAVQVLCSHHVEEDGTSTYQWGGGNYCARVGQAQSFVTKQDEKSRLLARREMEE